MMQQLEALADACNVCVCVCVCLCVCVCVCVYLSANLISEKCSR
jgi:hypothetical protein